MKRPRKRRPGAPAVEEVPAAPSSPAEVSVDLSEPLPDWVRQDAAIDPDAPDAWRYLVARRRAMSEARAAAPPPDGWVSRARLRDADGEIIWTV